MNPEKKVLIKMRRCIGISTILLVPLCFVISLLGNKWENEYGAWYSSLSSLYWTNARNIFVGLVFVIGMFYILYDGYSWKDKVVNTLTGCFLIGLALFPAYGKKVITAGLPTTYEVFPNLSMNIAYRLHMICAIGLFVTQEINIAFLFTKHAGEITKKKQQRNRFYKICAAIGFILLVTNEALIDANKWFGINIGNYTIITIQCLALSGIGIAWLVKSEAIAVLRD